MVGSARSARLERWPHIWCVSPSFETGAISAFMCVCDALWRPPQDEGPDYATFFSAAGAAMFSNPAALWLIMVRMSACENCRSSSCRTIWR